MSVLVLVLGVVATLTGIGAVGFGLPNGDSTVGNAAIIAGTTMLVGGLVLIGLAAAIGQLRRIADGLAVSGPEQRVGRGEIPEMMPNPAAHPERPPAMPESPMPMPMAPGGGPGPSRIPFPARPSSRMPPAEPPMPEQYAEEPPPQRAPVDVSARAIERMRSNIGRAGQRPPEPASPPAAPAPPPFVRQGRTPPVRGGNGAVPVEEERSFAEPPPSEGEFESERSKPPYAEAPPTAEPGLGEPRARPGMFDTLWPPETRSGKQRAEEPAASTPPMIVPPRVGTARHEREPEAPGFAPPQQPLGNRSASEQHPAGRGDAQAVAILKSGVVDGMAYTLYTDGSIEAQLASGTVRFASIGELRAHLDQNTQS